MDCPNENALAALFDGSLSETEAHEIEVHADACPRCFALIGQLGALQSSGAEEPPPARIVRGTAVGRYLILRQIGVGGMGVVFAAHDPDLDRRVALKLLRPDVSAPNAAAAQQRLVREAKAIARVSHPHVIAVYDVGVYEDRVFVAMEFVKGKTLAAWLAEGRHPWREVLAVFVKAGRGLAAAHAAGIVHRDFKPDNVLLGRDGEVRVADFGLARAAARRTENDSAYFAIAPAADDEPQASRADAVVGTPAYMSPEQRRGDVADARSDQYSFALALYEALYGERPGAAPEPRSADVPAWLRDAVRRAFSERPDDRHPSMDALLHVLESTPRARRRRWLLTAAAAGVLLASAAGWAALRRQERASAAMCTGAERELAGVWDDDRKVAVDRAFASTGLPYATQTSTQVRTTLDRYAHDWVATRTDACMATRLRGDQSEATLSLRLRCLDRRLRAMKTLTGIFVQGGAKVVDHAVAAAEGLAPADECSAAAMAMRGEEPRAADSPGEEAVVRARILLEAGKLDEADQAGKAALDAARSAARVEIEAEALGVLADVAAERRDGQDAEKLAFDAFTNAQRAGADAVAADAGTLLVYAVGVKSGRVDEGERWARLTEALIERMGGDDRLAVRLSAHRALMLAQGGRTREAIDEGRRAVRLAEPKAPPVLLAGALHSLAIALRNGGQNEEAAATLERVIDIDRRELGPGHPKEGDALSTLGILLMNEKRYEDARSVWERALPINARIDALSVNDLVMAAETSARLGRFAEADEHVGRALDTLRRRPDHYSFAVAYAVLGDLDRLEKKLDDSVADYGKSLDAYARSVGADSPPATPALIGLGFTQLARGKARDARALFERVLSILKDGISPGDAADVRVGLAQAIWQGGGDRASASAMLEQARAFYAQHPGADRDVLENERLLEAALGGRQ